MKQASLILFLVVFLFAGWGCNKDGSEVDQLEQEVMEAEGQDLLADSTAMTEAETAPEEYAAVEEEYDDTPTYEQTAYGGYTVQVGAGTDNIKASYMAEIYTERGYEPFITQAVVDDVVFYRIRIGNFETREEAKAFVAELADKYSVKAWIDINE